MDNVTNCIKIVTKCYFKENIERVFSILTDQSYYLEVNNGIINNISFKNNTNLDQIGSEYNMLYENILPITMKVTSVTNNIYIKKIQISSLNNNSIEFDLIHRLYWDSIENKTLYIKEVIIKRSIFPITKQGLKYYKNEQKLVKKRIKNLLSRCKVGSEIEESISINVNIEKLWNSVANWHNFIRLVPLIGENVFYLNHYEIEKTIFILWNRNIQYQYKIIKCKKTEYIKEILIEKLDSPKEIFHFKIVHISEMKSFLSYKTKFLEDVNDEYIKDLLEIKKKVLIILKKQLES